MKDTFLLVVLAFGALLGFFLSLLLRRAIHFEAELREIMWRPFEKWLRDACDPAEPRKEDEQT